MKKKFLSLILAISMIPAPIASYAEDNNECSKCREDLEWCMATNKKLYDGLCKSINLLTETNSRMGQCFDDLNTSRRDVETFKNLSTKCVDNPKSSKIDFFIYNTFLLSLGALIGAAVADNSNLIGRFVRNFRF